MRAFAIAVTVAIFLCVAARGTDAFADCPDPAAWGRCFERFDADGDRLLSPAEFDKFWDSVSWIVRKMLDDAKHYFARCDVDKSGAMTGFELLGDECMSTCVEKWRVYGDACR